MDTPTAKFLRSFDSNVRTSDFVLSEGKIFKVEASLKDYCRCKDKEEKLYNIEYNKLKKLNWVKYALLTIKFLFVNGQRPKG